MKQNTMKNWKNKPKKVAPKKVVPKNEEPVPYDSETVRLASLKRQKQAFKEKEQLIRNALKSVDSNPLNKKVVFDDDTIEAYENDTSPVVVEKKKAQLFEEEGGEEDDDDNDDIADLNFDPKPKAVTLGNDARFTLSQRFLEENEETKPDDDEEASEKNQENIVDEFTEEKNKQLEILESVVGKPIIKKTPAPAVEKKQKSIYRYDPMAPNHEECEQVPEEKPTKRKKQKTEETESAEAAEPPPVSSDVFFSVSNNLADALKTNEEFSLFSSFGAAAEPEVVHKKKENSMKSISSMSHEKTPFKYDSTDDENDFFEDGKDDPAKAQVNQPRIYNDTFFFTANDSRFRDAEIFFKTPAATKQPFNIVRRELKQIVRKKIRNNARKNQPIRGKIQTMKKRPKN